MVVVGSLTSVPGLPHSWGHREMLYLYGLNKPTLQPERLQELRSLGVAESENAP